jgi:hypothetical protein
MITKSSNKQITGKEVKTKEVFMFPGNPPIAIEAETREEAEKKFKSLINNK